MYARTSPSQLRYADYTQTFSEIAAKWLNRFRIERLQRQRSELDIRSNKMPSLKQSCVSLPDFRHRSYKG